MILYKEYRYDADICGPRPRAGIAFFVLSLLRFAIHEANYDICIINIVQTLWIG